MFTVLIYVHTSIIPMALDEGSSLFKACSCLFSYSQSSFRIKIDIYELTVKRGLSLWGSRMVIPNTLKREILE